MEIDIRDIIILGLLVLLIGLACNMLVITSNGNRMPVNVEDCYYSDVYISYSGLEKVKFVYLTDIFSLDNGNYIFSLGDVLAVLGSLVVILTLIYNFVMQLCTYKRVRTQSKKEMKNKNG
jgi:hypothetical protein